MTNPSIALILFGVAALLMIVVGGTMQLADLHWGLIASELTTLLLPALLVGVWLTRAPDRPAPLRIRGVGLSASGLLWLVLTSAVVGLAANSVTGLLAETVPGWHEVAKSYEVMFKDLMFPADPVRRMAAIVAIVIVAPVCEEALFRGVMLPLQREGARSLAAVLAINGMLFGLIHFNPLNFVALSFVGVFFAHVALLSGSLWPSILAHATLNLVNGVVLPELVEMSDVTSDPSAATYAIASLVLVPIASALWVAGARVIWRKDRFDA